MAAVDISQNGRLIYSLDDAYIHMAMAKNVVLHGVWGVTRYGFSSSTSSVLWTLVLSLTYFLTGVRQWTPLILNVLFCCSTLALVYTILRRAKTHPAVTFLVLTVLIFATPMTSLIFIGMEHSMHVLLTIWFAYLAARELSADGSPSGIRAAVLPIAAALLTTARYEGLFLLCITCVLLLIRGRFTRSVSIALAGLLPLGIYGLISVHYGWFALPNSILIKGHIAGASGLEHAFRLFGYRDYNKLADHRDLFILAVAAMVLFLRAYLRCRTLWNPFVLMPLMFLFVELIHIQYAATGWIYRYEAYLVAWGLVMVAEGIIQEARERAWKFDRQLVPAYLAALAAFVFLAIPFSDRGFYGTKNAVLAARDRYVEHVLPAEFVARYYPSGPVALNDLGAMAFFTHARILDLIGLGSKEPVVFRKHPGGYTRQDVQRWTSSQGVRLAVLQVQWDQIYPRIPSGWVEAAQMRIPRNVAYHDFDVGFFATNARQARVLGQQISEFLQPESVRLGAKWSGLEAAPVAKQSGPAAGWVTAARGRLRTGISLPRTRSQ